MKTWYLATFKWSDSGVYCTNLVLTDSEEKAEEHYSKYEMVSIRIADEWEVDSYRSRGCPVVELWADNQECDKWDLKSQMIKLI